MSNIEQVHCQSCGAPEQGDEDNEGYSSCCNERLVYTQGRDAFNRAITCTTNGDCSHE